VENPGILVGSISGVTLTPLPTLLREDLPLSSWPQSQLLLPPLKSLPTPAECVQARCLTSFSSRWLQDRAGHPSIPPSACLGVYLTPFLPPAAAYCTNDQASVFKQSSTKPVFADLGILAFWFLTKWTISNLASSDYHYAWQSRGSNWRRACKNDSFFTKVELVGKTCLMFLLWGQIPFHHLFNSCDHR
jgi:hypothetical protein